MKKKEKTKVMIAWILLIVLIGLGLGLSYYRFFGEYNNSYMEEKKVDNSTSKAIQTALTFIVDQFNQDERVQLLKEQNIQVHAVLKNYSIFITYQDDDVVTYEFQYDQLLLKIHVENQVDNLNKFHSIYRILIDAVQSRLNNTENVDSQIQAFLDMKQDFNYDGLTKTFSRKTVFYQMDITKKLSTLPE